MDASDKQVLLACSAGVYGILGVLALAWGLPGPYWRSGAFLVGLCLSAFCNLWLLGRRPLENRSVYTIGGQFIGLSIAAFSAPRLMPVVVAGLVWAGTQTVWQWSEWPERLMTLGWAELAGGFLLVASLAWLRGSDFLIFLPVYIIVAILSVPLYRQWELGAKDTAILSRSREAVALLAQVNLRLQEYTVQDQQLAVFGERTRMAREIHDTLGHTLTSILVQLGVLSEMFHARPEAVQTQVESIRQTAREGMLEVKAALDTLRTPGDEQPRGRQLWERVARVFSETTGVHTTVRLAEDFSWITEEINGIVYRLIQEGLTNAVRHGHAGRVEISVRLEEDYLLVRITDDGRGTAQVIEGHGIRGMRERVASVGGEITYRSNPGRGFDLGIDIPIDTRESG